MSHHPAKERLDAYCSQDRKLQQLLVAEWRAAKAAGAAPRPLEDVEFRTLSQNGEDGILLYIFTMIGTTSKRVVEICIGNGEQCNAANLLINHGWKGLLFEGNKRFVGNAQLLYGCLADTFLRPPAIVNAWITAENVNDLVRAQGFAGEIDLLALDIDGIDYWLWRALDCVAPRVVVLEYNGIWSAEHAVTVPYDPRFVTDFSRAPIYGGASLAAFDKLARERGYRFVGSERTGINAFFVRDDLADPWLPRAELSSALPYAATVDWRGRPWVEV